MDRGGHKIYHVHGFDSRKFLDTYLSGKENTGFEDHVLEFPIKKLHSTFLTGHITGHSLIDISLGSFIHHLYSACEFFKEIILLRASESCVMELNKWRNTCSGAFDWSHTTQMLAEITGTSDQSVDLEIKLKAALKPILRCDLNKEYLVDPEILPQADCVMTAAFLDKTSENEGDYKRNLKKIVDLLKPGGHLILFGFLKGTHFIVGEEKFHTFKYDEKFLREALSDEGLIIDDCEIKSRKGESDLVSYESVIYILARKCK